MKGAITLKILEKFGEVAVDMADLFEVFIEEGYGASIGRLDYALSLKKKQRSKERASSDFMRRSKQQYYSLLYRLKRDGLIAEKMTKEKKFLILTKRGKEKLALLNSREQLPKISYQKEKGVVVTIVIFDVPERERRKRDWLRFALRYLGLKMIQKSVWIGRVKIPEEFMDDIASLGMVDFVQIFQISKAGSLVNVL